MRSGQLRQNGSQLAYDIITIVIIADIIGADVEQLVVHIKCKQWLWQFS